MALLIVIWGLNWPLVKIALEDSPPIWFGALRLLIGTMALFALVAWRGQLRLPGRRDILIVLDVGLLQMCTFMILLNVALQFVEAGRAVIVAYTTPLWVVPGAVLFLGEKMTWRKTAGLLLGLGGIAVLFNPAEFDWSNDDIVLGNALLMLAALVWAILILHVRAHKWAMPPFQLAPWQALTALVPATLAAWALEDFGEVAWTGSMVSILAYNGFLATGFGVWAMVTVSRVLPAISSSLSFLGVPVVGLVSSIWLLGEEMTLSLGAGLVLIVAGLFLVLSADRAARKRA